jgi:uncharacterized SAM-binding protein YcdF (DUF218 family)
LTIGSNQRSQNKALEILAARGFTLPILVTSALHMARSVNHFNKKNITVSPYPTAYMSSKKTHLDIGKFLPSYEAVNKTGHALKEYAGLFIYKYFGISI